MVGIVFGFGVAYIAFMLYVILHKIVDIMSDGTFNDMGISLTALLDLASYVFLFAMAGFSIWGMISLYNISTSDTITNLDGSLYARVEQIDEKPARVIIDGITYQLVEVETGTE